MRKKKSKTKKTEPSEKQLRDLNAVEKLLQHKSLKEIIRSVSEPSKEALTRLGAIPLLYDEPRDLVTGDGAVIYDSWSHGPSVALRDRTDGHIRRLQLQADKVSLEIVAEMSKGRWEFVARAYRGTSVVHDFVMTIGKKKLLSESGGFYRWSSKGVPHKISLTSMQERFDFEKLSW